MPLQITLVGLVLCLLLSAASSMSAVTITFTQLPWDGAGRGINSRAFISGEMSYNPVLWNPDGTYHRIFLQGSAFAINESGTAVANVTLNGHGRAVRWRSDGTYTMLEPLPENPNTAAWGINDAGVVVGRAAERAFRWYEDGTLELLPNPLHGASTEAYAINNHSEVVGSTDYYHPTYWDARGNGFALPLLPGHTTGHVWDINDSGCKVGCSQAGTVTRPIMWGPDNKVIDIGNLADCTSGEALGINSLGQVVGRWKKMGSWYYRGFFWSEQTGMVDLGESTGVTSDNQAYDINNYGQIVGSGVYSQAVMWTVEVPEPSSASPLLIGIHGLAFLSWRGRTRRQAKSIT